MAGQGGDVSETMESARRWSGYVCPDCRFVFRVPRDHDGKGIVCPSCRRILRIPAPGDTPSPLIASVKRAVAEEPADEPLQRKTRKKRRGKHGEHEHEWERHSHGSRRGEIRQMRLMLIGGVAIFVLITAGVIVTMKGSGSQSKIVELKPAAVKETEPVKVPPVDQRSEPVILAEAEPLAKQFLEATRVEELLPLVRHPEVTEARIRKRYPDGKIPAPGLSQFNTSSGASVHGSIVAYSLTTRDQEEKSIVFIDGPQGLKVDWESWAAWSDLSWEEFLSKKPTVPHVFRVTLASIEYYNFSFTDDAKWQSYRLESPDGEHSIYGYVEKNSPLDGQIRAMRDAKSTKLMLSLKFPEGATSSSQVLIERFVTDGWVEEKETP